MAMRLKLLIRCILVLCNLLYNGVHSITCRSFATPPQVSNCTMDIFRFRVNTEPILPGINYSFHCEGDLKYEEVYTTVVKEIPKTGFPVQLQVNSDPMVCENYTAPHKFIVTARRVFSLDDHNKKVTCTQVLPSGIKDGWTFGQPLVKHYYIKISHIGGVSILGPDYVEAGSKNIWTCVVKGIGFDEEQQMRIEWRVSSNGTVVEADSRAQRPRVVTTQPHSYTAHTGLRLHDVNESLQVHVDEGDEDFILECRAQLDWLHNSRINILHSIAHKLVVSFKISSPKITGPSEVSTAGSYTWQCHLDNVEWEMEQQVTVDIFIRDKPIFHYSHVTCNTSLEGRRSMHSCVYTVNHFVPSTWKDFDVMCQLRHHPVGAVKTSERHRVVVMENRMLADRVEYELSTPGGVQAGKTLDTPNCSREEDNTVVVGITMLVLLALFLSLAVWAGCYDRSNRKNDKTEVNASSLQVLMQTIDHMQATKNTREDQMPDNVDEESLRSEESDKTDEEPSDDSGTATRLRKGRHAQDHLIRDSIIRFLK
ncbi:uncharacterized protein [Littorina saxatilis]|uniref:uncharacterized protein isoform X2 n=1 Tax=Littorina saxatilis TaxID=31220 RepID=UPI0038B5F528